MAIDRASMSDATPSISVGQIKAIWALSHRLGLDEGELRSLIRHFTGKESIRRLSSPEARRIIEEFTGKRGASDRERAGRVANKGGVTKAQYALVLSLADEIHWDTGRVSRLANKMYGADHLEDLSVREGSGLIEALKAIKSRRAA